MKHKQTTMSEQGYPLQTRRKYNVKPLGYWLPNYSENIELLAISSRSDMATVLVTTGSVLLGDQTVIVPASNYIWNEI